MGVKIYVTFAMAAALLIWVIVNFVYMMRRINRIVGEQDFKYKVRCGKCGNEHEISAEEFVSAKLGIRMSCSRTKIKGLMLHNEKKYRYLTKRFFCSECRKKCWSEVTDLNENQPKVNRIVIPLVIKHFLIVAAGGAVVIGVTGVIMKILDFVAKI